MPDGTLQLAYKILYELEHKENKNLSMGVYLSPEKLGVSETQWIDTMLNLIHEEYIAGVKIKENILGETEVNIKNIRITLKGAEYLRNNATMSKLGKVATDVITVASDIKNILK